ncbi:MAG: hypothetical protein CR967_00585 [Proteobacteria bacterium]|nr:MAG: hypothetical protein CR967_00585 [Pseudomonadota bacterium]
MKILFSPSEAKQETSSHFGYVKNSLCFEELFHKRLEIIEKYNDLLKNASFEEKSKTLGLKKEADINKYKPIDTKKCQLELAILRYSGVGYDYLDFSSLEDNSQRTILYCMYIFSNLLGVVKARDKIPFYKLKQGSFIQGIDTAKYYKQHFASKLDLIFEDELIIDLRAGYYDKFFIPKTPYISLKFLKNGRAVSHFAKAYRGLVARALAIHKPKDEKEFKQIPIANLHIKEIQIKGKKSTYIYDIID